MRQESKLYNIRKMKGQKKIDLNEFVELTNHEKYTVSGGSSPLYRFGAYVKSLLCDCYVNSNYKMDSGSRLNWIAHH